MPQHILQASIDDAVSAAAHIHWSISIRDAAGQELAGFNADTAMETASLGKLLLLIEVARRCSEGTLSSTEMLGRDPGLRVTDSGIWQHLHIDKLTIYDLCVLIASVSDNLAANALLQRVGFQSLRDLAASLGLVDMAVLDYIRDHRGPADPATFSTGSASELSRLMSRMYRKELVSRAVSDQMNAWLVTSVDLSMVGSAFHLDPLSHATSDDGFFILNKTGSDTGIRADVGTVGRSSFRLSYAVIANWETSELNSPDLALSGMSAIGQIVRKVIENNSG